MTPPCELPPALRDRPFRVVDALALGVSPMRLRASDLRAPHRGVRVLRSLERTLALDCACAALLLPPGSAFSGTTAVALLGLPQPWAPGPARPVPDDGRRCGTGQPVEAAVPRGLVRPRIAGVAVRPAGLVRGTPLVQRSGLPVLHPAEVWAQRCAVLPLEDAVALGDAVRRRARGAVLAEAVARQQDPPSRERAREVLQQVRSTVDSPAETRLRLTVIRAGLPEPHCGQAVPAGDHPVAWPDLSWPQARVAAEVDGLTHLDPRQRHLDLQRQRLLEELGWVVVVFSAREVRQHPDACAVRLRTLLQERWPR